MTTPFDGAIQLIAERGFHNHRLEDHSSVVSRGILQDLLEVCDPFREDHETARIREWYDFPSPGGRERKLDLVVAEPEAGGMKPDLNGLRLCVENKSVVTAHRNRTSRYDDLRAVADVLHPRRPDAILVATVLVGTAERVLNVPDRVKPFAPDFETRVLPRLSKGDSRLWTEFPHAVSLNRPHDPRRTVEKFRQLPIRALPRVDQTAYDYVFLVPVHIDNVNPPRVARDNDLGIDVDGDYREMLDRLCRAYRARWHL